MFKNKSKKELRKEKKVLWEQIRRLRRELRESEAALMEMRDRAWAAEQELFALTYDPDSCDP